MAGSKKGRQEAHNNSTGKYEKQKARTAKNKTRNIAKAERLKKKNKEAK